MPKGRRALFRKSSDQSNGTEQLCYTHMDEIHVPHDPLDAKALMMTILWEPDLGDAAPPMAPYTRNSSLECKQAP